MHGQTARSRMCWGMRGFLNRCDRYDTKPVLLTIEGVTLTFWYCPLHYGDVKMERSWLAEGWEFAY